MLTPSQISIKPNVMPIVVPDYDFENQIRWDGMHMMSSTFNTKQTFSSKGEPCDNTSDQD